MTRQRYIYAVEIDSTTFDPSDPFHVRHPDDADRLLEICHVEIVYRDKAGIAYSSPDMPNGYVSVEAEPDWIMIDEKSFDYDVNEMARVSAAIDALRTRRPSPRQRYPRFLRRRRDDRA